MHGVDQSGMVISGTGTVDSGHWTWNAEAVADGQTTKLRYTFDLVGKTDRKMTVEFQARMAHGRSCKR